MLTDKDIQKLMSVLATKDEVRQSNQEIVVLKETVNGLSTAIDSLAKVLIDFRSEYVAMRIQQDRNEQWIKQIADKTKIKLREI
jgi:pheromone shutdown protein TraB